jgi:SAM-dependent methyltransferase
MSTDTCILCHTDRLSIIEGKEPLVGVTSDGKPWPRMANLMLCKKCSHVQKRLDEDWFSDTAEIYHQYEMYPLSNGSEQAIFNEHGSMSRTAKLLEQLSSEVDIPSQGRLLDVGCGNGSFLSAFLKAYPEWQLFGFEQSDACRKSVLKIRGVEGFYSGDLEAIDGKYDIITLIHVIEHLFNPIDIMSYIRNLLAPGGIVLIQTPNLLTNPFDVVVADHCSHFYIDTLAYVAEVAGFRVHHTSDKWIPKEISLVASPVVKDALSVTVPRVSKKNITKGTIVWLNNVIGHARISFGNKRFGVFGTSNAGTWLAACLFDKVDFFVDEDPLKHGKKHMGIPILTPSEVGPDAVVYLAFPFDIAKIIFNRLQAIYPYITFVKPPILNSSI